MDTITLEAHNCDQRFSYKVTFEGPNAEDMAIEFMELRSSTHAISEWLIWDERWICAPHGGDEFYRQDELATEQPFAIDGNKYPRLYRKLYPTCDHGMSAWLCYGSAHYASDAEIAAGW
jgi:hypothetical protein